MAVPKLDYGKAKALSDKGMKGIDIAKKFGVTKGTVSRALKIMGAERAKAVMPAAIKYEAKQDAATTHLLYLADKAKTELDWIEDTVPPANNAEYREWQNQKLKFAAEMRKLIAAIGDIGYKLFQSGEVAEVLRIMDEEIGLESKDCQERIRDRIQRRRAIRFPVELHR